MFSGLPVEQTHKSLAQFDTLDGHPRESKGEERVDSRRPFLLQKYRFVENGKFMQASRGDEKDHPFNNGLAESIRLDKFSIV